MRLLAQSFRSSSRSADVVLHAGNAVHLILSVKACGLIEGVIAMWARMSVDTEAEKSCDEEVHVLCGKDQPIIDCRE